jgi:hypothetical protein
MITTHSKPKLKFNTYNAYNAYNAYNVYNVYQSYHSQQSFSFMLPMAGGSLDMMLPMYHFVPSSLTPWLLASSTSQRSQASNPADNMHRNFM